MCLVTQDFFFRSTVQLIFTFGWDQASTRRHQSPWCSRLVLLVFPPGVPWCPAWCPWCFPGAPGAKTPGAPGENTRGTREHQTGAPGNTRWRPGVRLVPAWCSTFDTFSFTKIHSPQSPTSILLTVDMIQTF